LSAQYCADGVDSVAKSRNDDENMACLQVDSRMEVWRRFEQEIIEMPVNEFAKFESNDELSKELRVNMEAEIVLSSNSPPGYQISSG
jgi:hypothetical protein